jgi:hypothetical protein
MKSKYVKYDCCLHDLEREIELSLSFSLIGKARKNKNKDKNYVCDGLEGSDNGKNKEIRKCLGKVGGGGEMGN